MIKVLYYYPFTLPGSAAFLTVLFAFGKGYADSDYQSIFISLVFFIILLFILSVGYIYAARFRLNEVSVKSKGETSSSENIQNEQLIIFEEAPPVFFRYSYALRGKFHASEISFKYFERFNSDRNGIIKFNFRFNLPGTLEAETSCFIEDIFGLIRIPCNDSEKITVRIIPGLPEKAERNKSDSMSSFVKNKKPDENDYEKILMREYMRGDRSRDINWKASSKSNTIYTKIAPGNDNEIKKINLVFIAVPEIFSEDIYCGILIYKFFREYFRFFINDLHNIEKYKFNIFLNGKKIAVNNRSGLENVYRELSLPEISNDFEKLIHDAEGSFVVFCENRDKIQDYKSVFVNASGVRYFYPEIVNKEFVVNKTYSPSGYEIDAHSFDYPGKGIFTGTAYLKSMRNFNKNIPVNTVNDSETRAVEIIL